MGATGVGKSTMCNFFFGINTFHTAGGMIRVTPTCNSQCHSFNGKNIMFIDSPGFSDTITDNKKRMQEMSKALIMARNGVHAIVVCLNGAGRFDIADEGFMKELKKLEIDEPKSIWAYIFVVFTHGLGMGETEEERRETVHTWRSHSECPTLLKELLDKVGNRFMVIESKMKDKNYHAIKFAEFSGFIEQIYATNHNSCYTNRLFIWARDKYEEAAKKQEEIIDKEQDVIKKQVDMLQKNVELIARLENEKSEQINKLQEIKEELHKAEIQLNNKERVISEYEEKVETIQKNETIRLQDAFHKLNVAKGEVKMFKELVEKKQYECSKSNKETRKTQEELEKKQKEMNQLQKLLHDRQIKGKAQTLKETLELMINDMEGMQQQVAAKENQVIQLTQNMEGMHNQLVTKENQVTQLTQNMEGVKSQLTTTENQVTLLTQNMEGVENQLATTENQVTQLRQEVESYNSAFGIPIPLFNRKIVFIRTHPT